MALGPVAWLWERLSGWQQDQVEAATQVELAQLASLGVAPEDAPRLLADRLTDRLQETGGEARVTGPYGWLIRRGLAQRPSCSDLRCDDGIRLDTGTGCENCQNVLLIRRGRRARISADIDRELPGLSNGERRRALDERLREQTEVAAADLVRRREQADRDRLERAARWAAARERTARQQEAADVAAAALRAQPCRECGAPDASGLCEVCDARASTARLLRDAADLGVVARCDVTDPGHALELAEHCQVDTWLRSTAVEARAQAGRLWRCSRHGRRDESGLSAPSGGAAAVGTK